MTDLPHALRDGEQFAERLGGARPAVFTDYDGVLTPIVDRPEDALISASMREVLRELASRCPVCVVSGRDRAVVQQLMGVDDLVVAGSHGFDIWSPEAGTLEHEAGSAQEGLIENVTAELDQAVGDVPGVAIEPKKNGATNPGELAFLASVRQSACKRFTTVLGPGSDAEHGDHLHVDLRGRNGGYRICQ